MPNGNTVEYTYDVLGNLKTKQEKDPNGAVVSTVDYQYNSASQLTQVGSSSYTYDKNGNVTSDGTRSYKWDAGGRLVEVDDANGTAIAAYSYDSLNRMVQKTANGSTTNYLYDGMSSHVVAEYDGSGKQLMYYTWGPSGLLSITTDGKTYYAVHGRRGDIEALTDATGNVVVTYKYDTWGNLLSYTDDSGVGLAMSNPYRYADYRYDSDVGMYYLMARWYDSGVGRFLSPDPISTMPSYVYAGNNPVSFVDPTGYVATKYEDLRLERGTSENRSITVESNESEMTLQERAFWAEYIHTTLRSNLNKKAAQSEKEAKNKNYNKLKKSESVFHQMGKGNESNTKYVSPNGKLESVFDKEGKIVKDPVNLGTYNFVPPTDGFNHALYDVLPYYIFGNSPDDTSTFGDKVNASIDSILWKLIEQ